METTMLMILMASALLVLVIVVGLLVIHLLHKSDELKEKNDVIVREVRRNQALIDRAGDMDQITTLDGFYPGTRFVVGKPILSDDTTIGYVFLSSNTTSIMGAYRAFIGVMLAVMAAVILFALLLSLFFSKKLSEPLEDMVTATRRFSHGDFSTRIDYQGNQSDEITVLVDSFNEMAESLEKTEIRRQEFISNISHELRTPMTTITGFAEGILDGTIPQEDQNKYMRPGG